MSQMGTERLANMSMLSGRLTALAVRRILARLFQELTFVTGGFAAENIGKLDFGFAKNGHSMMAYSHHHCWTSGGRGATEQNKGSALIKSIDYIVLLIGALTASTAAATTATSQPDYILQNCQETEQGSTVFGGISPEYMIKNYIQNRDNRPVELPAIKNVTVIKLPTHGKLIDNGLYIPEPNYFGKDKVLFMAEFEGKRYKIILDIHVVTKVDESDSPTTSCPPPNLIKVNGK